MSNTYTIRVYENTGFNAVNIPLDKSVVNSSAVSYKECNGLTLTQPRFLSTINVPLKYADVNNADYCIIWAETEGTTIDNGWCYFITNVAMQAEDVASLQVVPDYLTSAGGVDDMEFIDGIVTRSTHALNNINPMYLDEDPYLAPAETMQIETDWIDDGSSYMDVIETTIDLVETAQADDAETAVALSGDTVTYPVPKYASNQKNVVYSLSNTGSKAVQMPCTMLFDSSSASPSSDVNKGLAKVRGMGLESAIIHQARIPTKFVSGVLHSGGSYYDSLQGEWGEETTTINMIQDTDGTKEAGVVNFSPFTKYGLMSASGACMEVEPKELMEPRNPTIRYVGDPRPDGKPYFRFKYVHNANDSYVEFFRNCIEGLPWKQIPLVFTQPSGNMLNTTRYDATRKAANLGLNQANRAYGLQKEFLAQNYDQANSFQLLGLLGSGIDMAGSALVGVSSQQTLLGIASGNTSVEVGGGEKFSGLPSVSSLYSQGMNYLAREMSNAQAVSSVANAQLTTAENYAMNKLADQLNYGISQSVSVPTVMFPYNTETLRDFFGNGVLVYRYIYTVADRTRIKRILRAYGAKYAEKITKAHFIPEANKEFAYVEASGVSVADKPQWLANGVAMQLANGVRVWKVRPHSIA